MARMRIVGWQVAPILMADDGENLLPVNVQPQIIAAAAWEAWKAGEDAKSLDALRAQIEGVKTTVAEPENAA